MRSNKNSVKNKTEGLKSTHPVIQRKTAVINKENIPQNKTTAPVTKMTVHPRVLVGHQSENMSPILAQFQQKPDPLVQAEDHSVTTVDSNKEGKCSGVEDNACVAENSLRCGSQSGDSTGNKITSVSVSNSESLSCWNEPADEISFSSTHPSSALSFRETAGVSPPHHQSEQSICTT